MSGRRKIWLALLIACGIVAAPAAAPAFVCLNINGHCVRWTSGNATLRLFLGTPTRLPLTNGTLSWDQNGINAANDWNAAGAAFHFNPQIGGQFNDPCGAQGGAHVCPNTGPIGDNPVFFSNSFCGQAFGDIIELTNNCADRNSGAMINAPVFVNSSVPWDAYDGRIRFANGQAVNDIRRVLLHEFGHVLGLDHPDANGQNVVAIMNSRESDLDRLQQDDIDGLISLYPNGAGSPSGSAAAPTSGCAMQATAHAQRAWLLMLPLIILLFRTRRGLQ